jgi:hypothetical protein
MLKGERMVKLRAIEDRGKVGVMALGAFNPPSPAVLD